MKIFTVYLLFLAWIGYFFLNSHHVNIVPSFISLHTSCSNETEENEIDNCCKKIQHEDSAEKKCSHEEEESDCCGKSDCSRICCNIFLAKVSSQTEYDFTLQLSNLNFYGFPNPHFPKPYIGKFSPPPNG